MIHKINFKSLGLLLLSLTVFTSCEREIADDAPLATFPTNADIYTDNPVGLTDEFFISFDPADGANPNAFGTDDNEAFLGTSSIRIDVPAPDNPEGTFVGAIFRDRGEGRDLSGYDALTFWAKGSLTGTLGEVGFGTDFLEGRYPASVNNIKLSTDWKKYIIPIPDPSKLTQERGMFLFAAGSYDVLQNDDPALGTSFDDNLGWTFWLDEIRFEKLGTSLLSSATLFNGQNLSQSGFSGSSFSIFGGSTTFNLENGQNLTVNTSPAYFDYNNESPAVATVNLTQDSSIEIIGDSGTTTITATIQNTNVQGSYSITSTGQLPFAPLPNQTGDIASVFSDAYTPAVGINFDPRFGGSTTQASLFERENTSTTPPFNDQSIVYTSNNFTGIVFEGGTVDATNYSTMHIDIFVQEPDVSIEFQIRDIGSNGEINTNTNTGLPEEDDVDYRQTESGFIVGEWRSIDIPLAGNLANQKDNIGAIILIGGPNFILDNIYFY